MDKWVLFLSFVTLVLCGFLFAYVLWVTGKVVGSYWIMLCYYFSLCYIVVQFIEKPSEARK